MGSDVSVERGLQLCSGLGSQKCWKSGFNYVGFLPTVRQVTQSAEWIVKCINESSFSYSLYSHTLSRADPWTLLTLPPLVLSSGGPIPGTTLRQELVILSPSSELCRMRNWLPRDVVCTS